MIWNGCCLTIRRWVYHYPYDKIRPLVNSAEHCCPLLLSCELFLICNLTCAPSVISFQICFVFVFHRFEARLWDMFWLYQIGKLAMAFVWSILAASDFAFVSGILMNSKCCCHFVENAWSGWLAYTDKTCKTIGKTDSKIEIITFDFNGNFV